MQCDQRRRRLLAALSATPTLTIPSALALPKPMVTVNMALAYLNGVVFKSPHQR